jgi:hypothetical protein
VTGDDREFYLECERLRSQGRRHLVYCFVECERKCAAFHGVPHRVVLKLIAQDEGRHPIEYRQFRLF